MRQLSLWLTIVIAVIRVYLCLAQTDMHSLPVVLYKDAAHIYIGFLGAVAYYWHEPWAIAPFWLLIAVEVVCASITILR